MKEPQFSIRVDQRSYVFQNDVFETAKNRNVAIRLEQMYYLPSLFVEWLNHRTDAQYDQLKLFCKNRSSHAIIRTSLEAFVADDFSQDISSTLDETLNNFCSVLSFTISTVMGEQQG